MIHGFRDLDQITDEDYSKLQTATLTLDYLESNSSTHTHAFSAIAELADNAYDANAANLFIDIVKCDTEDALEILDDGDGMSREEAIRVITFGHSAKEKHKIGRYGNGLKSGAFHLGRELFLLTKQGGVHTVLFISHKFQSEVNLSKSIFCCCPSFDEEYVPICNTELERSRFQTEIDIIMKFAPFGRHRNIAELFDRIPGTHGTLIIITNLRRGVTGELNMKLSDPTDIRLYDDDKESWKSSLKEYFKVLYLKPKMRINLRGYDVYPTKIEEHWIARYSDTVQGEHFLAAYQQELNNKKETIRRLERDVGDLESQIGTLNHGTQGIDKESRISQNKLHLKKIEAQELLNREKSELVKFKKSFKSYEKKINFFMGLETKDRSNNGIHFYINNRLIEWGHKSPFFKKFENSIGISMFVSLNYEVFLPTNNKQKFMDDNDFKLLLKKCDAVFKKYVDYLERNWIGTHLWRRWDIKVHQGDDQWNLLWKCYGYASPQASKPEPLDEKGQDIFWKECGIWNLCRQCRQWRHAKLPEDLLAPNSNYWVCENVRNKSCRSVQDTDFPQIPANYKALVWPRRGEIISRSKQSSCQANNFKSGTSSALPAVDKPFLHNMSTGVVKIENETTVETINRNEIAKPTMPPVAIKSEPIGLSEPITEIERIYLSLRGSSPSLNNRPMLGANMDCRSMSSSGCAVIEDDIEEIDEFDITVEEVGEGSSTSEDQVRPEPTRKRIREQDLMPPTRNSRKRIIRQESDSDFEYEEVEVVNTRKKTRHGKQSETKTERSRTSLNREKWLEENLNKLLVSLGQEPLPKNGQREIDSGDICRRFLARSTKTVDRAHKELANCKIKIDTLINYLKSAEIPGLKIPPNSRTTDVLDSLVEQIEHLSKRRRN